MKKLIYFSMIIFLLINILAKAQPFGPPIYIANPVSLECKYYFAGNEKHFNPRPENFTIDIGYTTDFVNQDQGCEFWKCIYTKGTVKVDNNNKPLETNLCSCPSKFYWDDLKGCVKSKEQNKEINFIQLIWKWISSFFHNV